MIKRVLFLGSGIALGFLLATQLAASRPDERPRFTIYSQDGVFIKMDQHTGKSWIQYGGWHEIPDLPPMPGTNAPPWTQ